VAPVLTAGIAVVGGLSSMWLARAARRYAVIDRVARPVRGPLVLPPRVRARLAEMLDAAMVDASPEHAVQVALLVLVVLALIGVAIAPVLGLVGVFAVVIGGPFALHALRHRRARAITAAVPTTLDRVASELRAGGTVATAVAGVASDDGPLAGDFARVEARTRLGAALPDALATWSRERSVPGAASAAGALAVAHEVGGRAADALESLAMSLREQIGVAAEARALSAQARSSAIVVGVGPLAYIAFSFLLDRRAVDALIGTPAGRLCLVVGLGLEAFGAWWMRRILANGAPA
jgi:tight adherence protein B